MGKSCCCYDIKICNLALQEERLRRQPYFSKDINSGPADREVEGRGGEGDGGCDTCAGGGRMAQTEGTSGAEGNAAPLDVSMLHHRGLRDGARRARQTLVAPFSYRVFYFAVYYL